ncbi:MAG: hypothetical protein ABRQ26_15570 [Syntrophomonadaceae bacterium]
MTRIKKGLNHMKPKLSSYLISAVLFMVAFLPLLGTLSPWLFKIIDFSSPSTNNGFEVPMRVVGANYPISALVILASFFIIGMFIVFLYAKKSKTTSIRFWINGISISLIVSQAIMWIELFLS